MYGAILEKGEKFTCLRKIFNSIGNLQNEYNWLITNCVCYPTTQKFNELLGKSYCWMSGDELTSMVDVEDFQWIWAVLSGFSRDIPLSKVLDSPLPYADGYTGFWENPVSIQNPLASIEIVPWDSSLMLLISTKKEIIDSFMKAFPLSEDLFAYNLKEAYKE